MTDLPVAELAWNDPTLEAAESAPCSCGHEAIDHRWHGCEEYAEGQPCPCHKSAAHVLIASPWFAAERAAAVEDALGQAMQRILDTRSEDEDGWGMTQGMTNAASVVALCIVENAERES